ncbi:MAG: cytochrome P450 [Verrucomicrobiales bacterium]|nr:cytochrome P450 [Verrucomicrobiales bacterium]
MLSWFSRTLRQLRGDNPFQGDALPGRVSLFHPGHPVAPVPTPWNYREPLRIFEAFYTEAAEAEGDACHSRYLDLPGMKPVLVTRDPAFIKAIQAMTGDKPGQFDRDTAPTAGIGRATGTDSLLYSNGAQWRYQKSLAAQPFSRSNLFQPQKFAGFEQTFRKTVAQRLEMLRAAQAQSGEKRTRIELEPEIQAVMLEMLVNNFFGASVPYAELRDRFVPALVYLIDHMVRDTVLLGLLPLMNRLTGEHRVVRQHAAAFEELTDLALAGRAEGRGCWGDFESDASNAALRANIRVFLAGAMEATTSFAGWAISHLSHHPDWQEKIFEEVRHLHHYDPDDFTQARSLNLVLEETLRLTPALYFLPRRATVDTWVETADHRRMWIPRGTHLRLDVWNANRCEVFWGKDVTGYAADVFAPERWDEMKKRGLSAKEMLHFGFGYGPRFCPGRSLGLLEVGLVVGAMVKLFRFSAAYPDTPARAGVSTKPGDGVLVDLELRG